MTQAHAPFPPQDGPGAGRDRLAGIGLRLSAVFLMTGMSAAIHAVADRIPVGQIMFWRAGFAILPILLYMIWRREFPQALTTRRPMLHLTRGIFGAISMALSFVSLAYLPVANAQALAYLAPILALPLAVVLLQEVLARVVLVAVGMSFLGMIALLWEAFALPGDGAWIGVAAGVGFALTMAFMRVHVRRMTFTERPSTIALSFALISALGGLATLPFGWVALDPGLLTWLALAGAVGGVGHILATEAMARAPVSVLAPFEYTGLIWALGFDAVFFGHLPGLWGWIGTITITVAALLVTFFPTGTSPGPGRLRGK
ncbi:DMT family transporter [Aliiroseovarius crassostreae]|uniref:DMT family transporter n=1 Tax=Aliiroseovarius crassostreae TaxID=154981 RepID=UPI003C7CEE8E